MARASVRVAFGLLAGFAMVAAMPATASAAETAGTGCVASIMYVAPEGPVTIGTSEPWSLPLLRGQPDPDHLRRECPGGEPQLRRPLWHGPAWGIPSLGSFV